MGNSGNVFSLPKFDAPPLVAVGFPAIQSVPEITGWTTSNERLRWANTFTALNPVKLTRVKTSPSGDCRTFRYSIEGRADVIIATWVRGKYA